MQKKSWKHCVLVIWKSKHTEYISQDKVGYAVVTNNPISINLSKYYVSLPQRGTRDPVYISFLYSDPSVLASQCKLFFFIFMAREEMTWSLTQLNKCIYLAKTFSFLCHWPKNTKGVGKSDDHSCPSPP